MDLLNFHSPRGQSLSCHARDHLPPTDNTHNQQPKNNQTYNTTQPHKTLPSNGDHDGMNDEQEKVTTHPTSKRKAEANKRRVKKVNQRDATVDDDKINCTRGNKSQKIATKQAKSVNKPPTTARTDKNQAEINVNHNKPPPIANDKAETADETGALNAASKDYGGDEQTNNGERQNNSKQTSKSDDDTALESSSDCNHSGTQGLTTPVKGTTVSKNGVFHFGKTHIYFFSLYLIMYHFKNHHR